MGDMGIDPSTVPPKDQTLAALQREEQFYEAKMRIAGLRRTIHALNRDIDERKERIGACEQEIARLEAHVKSLEVS